MKHFIANDLWSLILDFLSNKRQWIFQNFSLVCKLFDTIAYGSLERLSITSENKFTLAPLYKFKNLKQLIIYIEDFFQNLKVPDQLQELDIRSGQIGFNTLKTLAPIFEKVQTLCLHNNKFKPNVAKAFYPILGNLKQLKELCLGFITAHVENIKELAIALKELKNLNVLSLFMNSETKEEDTVQLVSALCELKELQKLRLKYCVLHQNGSTALASFLTQARKLQVLDLELSEISYGGMQILVPVLKELKQLKSLDLACTALRSDSIQKLSFALIELKQLKKLRLSFNNIGDEELEILVPALKELKKLKWLDLGYNKIKSNGVLLLVSVLNELRELKGLNLGDNWIDLITIEKIFLVLKELKSLKYVDLNGFCIDYDERKQMREMFKGSHIKLDYRPDDEFSFF